MKRSLLAAVAALLCLVPALAFAGGASSACATKYPVVLAHGMGATAEMLGIIDYWWGIEDALEEEGADVYATAVNCMDSTVNKAVAFKKQYLQILALTGKAKANIIGHSHGTIYTRYAITNLGLGNRCASHTSIAGPHKGSSVADVVVYKIPDGLLMLGTSVIDFVYAFVFGDTNPDTLQNTMDLCTDYMTQVFNPNTPNVPGVYYQSWAAKAKLYCPTVLLNPTWLLMKHYEGDNDGLVGVESAKWGRFRGVQSAAWWSPGCDHLNIIGQLFGMTPGFDAHDFFSDIVSELKKMGY
ncbi:MAG: alpha/beta fold hydrolase [Thermodesulfobacteriota bacterium]